jgi:pyrophosphate--fructose-6-phosphate 1-phosphotransferase
MAREISELERARAGYAPGVPELLGRPVSAISIEEGDPSSSVGSPDTIRERFPRTFGRPLLRLVDRDGSAASARPLVVGVVLSGGQAPGGHNVISGIFDALQSVHAGSRLLGFRGGPKGILESDYVELTEERIAPYRNTGGFDIIGSGRDKLETPEQLEACRTVCSRLGLNGLVVIGGDDSNTNAALLAEYFADRGETTSVVGCPQRQEILAFHSAHGA